MKKELTRRDLIGRAGLLIGGAVTLGALQACGEDDTAPLDSGECADTAAKLKDFPYEKHLPAGFALAEDGSIQEAAYHGYYAAAPGGGCGHGAYSALLSDLTRAGNPFDQLPLYLGQFGAGGVAGYGSICGAVLGSVLVINSVVADSAARGAMMTTLMRWYETHEFPAYAPTTIDPVEAGATKLLNWGAEAEKPAVTKVAPGAHLCHASVSGWCAAQSPMVGAGGADKKARCARVTADVTGKVIELVNAYLSSGALGARTFTAQAASTAVTQCTTCHGSGVTKHNGTDAPSVLSGMSCPTCHGNKVPLEGLTHTGAASCDACH